MRQERFTADLKVPAIPGPAAVANAIRDAVGVRMTELPIRPEAVVRRLTSGT